MDNNNTFSSQQQLDMQAGLNAYITKIFGTMFLGLLVTAIAAFFVASSDILELILLNTPLVFVLVIAELVIVFVLSLALNKLSHTMMLVLFYGYALINGITLSSIFVVYTPGTIYAAFITAAASFGAMAFYGLVTKKDLTKIGSMLCMLLFGVVIASLINLFLGSESFDLIISFVAVAIFVGLVAYDTQKLKSYYYMSLNDKQMQKKVGIIGALSLYLDFINIFLRLLRIFASKRD